MLLIFAVMEAFTNYVALFYQHFRHFLLNAVTQGKEGGAVKAVFL